MFTIPPQYRPKSLLPLLETKVGDEDPSGITQEQVLDGTASRALDYASWVWRSRWGGRAAERARINGRRP